MSNDKRQQRWDWSRRMMDGALWNKMEPLLPLRNPHPLGCHNPRVPDRNAMNAILFVLRTGCQWNALNATGICSSSSAHRRFVEWTEAGVFQSFWREGLLAHAALAGLDWSWLSMDGAVTKAPLAGSKNGTESDRSEQAGDEAESIDRGLRPAVERDHRGGQPP